MVLRGHVKGHERACEGLGEKVLQSRQPARPPQLKI